MTAEPTALEVAALWLEVAAALGVLFVDVAQPAPEQRALFALEADR